LALAFGIKYYPAIFGLILLKRKKWKDCILSAVLGSLIFLVPMIYVFFHMVLKLLIALLELLMELEDKLQFPGLLYQFYC